MKRFSFLSLAVGSLLLVACGQNPSQHTEDNKATDNAPEQSALLERINKGEAITVGTEGTYTPFTYHDETGKLTGYDVEVTRAVAQKLGVPVEFKETQWDAMLAGLDAKRFDMVANQISLTTPERQAKYDKSIPYSWSRSVVVTRAGDNRIQGWDNIRGLNAAQSLGSHYGEIAEKYGANILPVEGMAQSMELLKQKRADFTINDQLAVLDYLNKHPESGLQIQLKANDDESRGAGLALRKGEDAVLAKINEAMTQLQDDGTLTKLSNQFFGQDISKAPNSAQGSQDTQANQTN